MIKNFTFTFDFNTETEIVSNVKFVGASEKKKTTTKPAKNNKLKDLDIDDSKSIIYREDNRLTLTNACLKDLGIEEDDDDVRISVEYINENDKMIPVISVGDKGNKLNKKANTVAFRGKQNEVLEEFGTEFKLEKYKDGFFKLINSENKENSNEVLEKELPDDLIEELNEEKPFGMELDLLTETDEIYNIDEIEFTL